MVELLVAVAIVSIVLTAVYIVYASSSQSFTTQDVAAGVQQSIRAGMELMAHDIRMAGFAPEPGDHFGIEEADSRKIRFTLDTLDSALSPPDYNGVIDTIGKERITYRLDTAAHQLLKILDEGTASQVQYTMLDHVTAVSFQYVDQTDTIMGAPVAAADLEDIRGVNISVTIQEPAGRDQPVTRTLAQRVMCRNLGL